MSSITTGKPRKNAKGKWVRTDVSQFDGRITVLVDGSDDVSPIAWDDVYMASCPACRAEQDHSMDYHQRHAISR